MDQKTEPLPGFVERFQESFPVVIIAINRPPLVAAHGKLIDRGGKRGHSTFRV